MANSTGECDFPSTVQSWVSVALVGIFILVALSLQSFIVAVNVTDWVKGRSVVAADQIITSLGIMRIISLFSCPLHYLSYVCFAEFGATFMLLNLFTGVSPGFASIWLSTLLSTFFCFKISTINSAFFLRLKTFISQRVVCLILISVLLGFSHTFTMVWLVHKAKNNHVSFLELLQSNHHKQLTISLNYFWNILPLLFYFASSVFLVICLRLHIRQMSSHGSSMTSTDTYHRMIMYTAVSFLICALSGIVNVTETLGLKLVGAVWMHAFWNLFPLLHCISLIYITAKLRNEFLRIVHWRMDCLFWRKASEPGSGEPIEITRL